MVSSHHWFLYQSLDFSAGFRGTSLPKSSRCLKSPGVRIIRVPTRKRRIGYLFLTGENRSNSLRSLTNCSVAVTVTVHQIEVKTETISVPSGVQWLWAVWSPNLIRTFHFYKQLYWGKLRNILQVKVKIISARSVFSCHLYDVLPISVRIL